MGIWFKEFANKFCWFKSCCWLTMFWRFCKFCRLFNWLRRSWLLLMLFILFKLLLLLIFKLLLFKLLKLLILIFSLIILKLLLLFISLLLIDLSFRVSMALKATLLILESGQSDIFLRRLSKESGIVLVVKLLLFWIWFTVKFIKSDL